MDSSTCLNSIGQALLKTKNVIKRKLSPNFSENQDSFYNLEISTNRMCQRTYLAPLSSSPSENSPKRKRRGQNSGITDEQTNADRNACTRSRIIRPKCDIGNPGCSGEQFRDVFCGNDAATVWVCAIFAIANLSSYVDCQQILEILQWKILVFW
eukprot:TRINITY_DN15934_c0_g1_i1.p3 TRINITY_DN15934_c0_g1~~TRINITY_DN15934_c0_g1_i1.p3  ORF type:complete len:154 (-),score=6.27 TRINITY_DN15934_c0_g1_i1:240-701(-)